MITTNLQDFYETITKDKPLLAIDYGMRKLGIAISTPDHKIAMPYKVLIANSDEARISAIMQIFPSFSPCALVLGLPLNMDGTSSAQSKLIEAFAKKLYISALLPIYLQDERLSSQAADSFLESLGMRRKARNEIDDKIAASLILESTLEGLLKLSTQL